MTDWPVHGRISGPIVMIGFGSIGRGTLPLIERHFTYDKAGSRWEPSDSHKALAEKHGLRFEQVALTKDNYREILTPLLTEGGGQGFCVNLSVDTSSRDIMELCREIGALYIDTVAEPWPGFYFDKNAGPADRTNYALREQVLEARRRNPGGPTRGVVLRRQSRHGVVVRQAGAPQPLGRARPRHAEPKTRESTGPR